jgi:predicted nucleic acid-binding protein
MVDKVVDASAIAAMLFGEAEGPAVAAQLTGARLLAPAFIAIELGSVCVKKVRRAPELRGLLLHYFALRTTLRIEMLDIDSDAVVALALDTGLTGYDASYLWLARDLRAELVTLDKQLARAAAAH